MKTTYCPYCLQLVQADTCPHCGKNITAPRNPMHLPVGHTLQGEHSYILGAALGQGGFGITYIALDAITGIRVAVKEYFPAYCSGRNNITAVQSYLGQEEIFQKGKEQFLLEAQTLQSLSDLGCIVNVLDYFESNNTAYLVMEYLEGCSLKEYVLQKGIFPAQQFLQQLKPLMEDIDRMHQRGVIHRDIAPDNIILQPDGCLKLIDFGTARSYLGDKSMSVVVKKGFAPVEQYLSKGSGTYTDVYALAATIYYCITGQVPMDSAERQYRESSIPSPRKYGAMLNPGQEKALAHALAIQPKARTQLISQLIEELGSESVPEAKSLVTRILEAFGTVRKQKWFVPAAAVSLALVLVLASGLPKQDGNIPLYAHENAVKETSIAQNTEPLQDVTLASNDPWHDNVLILDNNLPNILSIGTGKFLKTDLIRQEITAVTFLDHLTTVPAECWDVSEAQDGSIVAWAETEGSEVHVFIAGDGGINGVIACKNLFAGCKKLTSISFNNALHTDDSVNMNVMFYGCNSLTELDLSSFDTSKVTSMVSMFNGCESLTRVDLRNFDTSNVTNMNYMFMDCHSLRILDVSSFDTSKVTDMSFMFSGCQSLTELDLSSFDTSKVTDMSYMFSGCQSLTNLNFRNFDISRDTNISDMFYFCDSLTILDLGDFDISSIMDMQFLFTYDHSINGKRWEDYFN